MANSTVTATVYAYPNGVDNTQRRQIVQGTLAIQASPGQYALGGLALATVFKVEPIKNVSGIPISLFVYTISGSGYTYVWNRATNKLQIFTTGAALSGVLAELAAGNMPAGVSSDIIEFEAEFVHNE